MRQRTIDLIAGSMGGILACATLAPAIGHSDPGPSMESSILVMILIIIAGSALSIWLSRVVIKLSNHDRNERLVSPQGERSSDNKAASDG